MDIDVIEALCLAVGEAHCLTGDAIEDRFLHDWMVKAPPGRPLASAYVRSTSISLLSAKARVSARLIPDRSRASEYVPCCERAIVPMTSVQSRTTARIFR